MTSGSRHPPPENQTRVIQAIRAFGFAATPHDVLDGPNAMPRMGNPPLRIEVLKTILGVEFDGCWDRRVELQIEELQIAMISLADLKTDKRTAARPKDLADLSNLP